MLLVARSFYLVNAIEPVASDHVGCALRALAQDISFPLAKDRQLRDFSSPVSGAEGRI